ncbi:MAG: ATP-binding cassette domain-containing protein [Alphaproteobacteria bacterium]
MRSIDVLRGDVWALHGVSLGLREDEITAVCGPNGAGKSTLMALLAGERLALFGDVLLDGRPIADFTPRQLAERRAVLEQSPRLDTPFSVRALARFGLAAMPGIPPRDAEAIVDAALEQAGVADLQARPITRLSGGERHRAHLARALAQSAGGRHLGHGRHLLLDEPTASLDLAQQIRVMHALRQAVRDGTGVLVVLHDLNLAAAFADRVVLMRGGRIIADGPPAAVLTGPRLSQVYGAPLSVIAGPGRSLRIAPDLQRATGNEPRPSPEALRRSVPG